MNDDLFFAEEDDSDIVAQPNGTWKILIVDDEPEVHTVTRLALRDFKLNNVGLTFISAYSGDEAIRQFEIHDDIAVVLLDVVMETDDAGLIVADKIRNELNNTFTRIILRTGQPGQAPEKKVIVNYDINDYKSKTELTAQKLFTVIIAALRSYRDIRTIEQNRVGLAKVMSASTDLFTCRSLSKFVEGLVQQLGSVLGCAQSAVFVSSELIDPTVNRSSNSAFELRALAGHGKYADVFGKPLTEVLDSSLLSTCQDILTNKGMHIDEEHVVAYCHSQHFGGALLYMSDKNRNVSETSIEMVELFTSSIQVAFENILLLRESRLTQNELIERLCRAMDFSTPSNNHIPRLVATCELLANQLGMKELDIDRFKVAVPMHDVGNCKLPEAMLNRRGPITPQEQSEMHMHTQFGAECFADSNNLTVQLAAKLAQQHHERWDGTGYPNRIAGEEILLESRILAAADVFDALYNKKSYKDAWDLEKVIGFFESESGKAFAPDVVDSVLKCKVELVEIQNSMKDGVSIFSH